MSKRFLYKINGELNDNKNDKNIENFGFRFGARTRAGAEGGSALDRLGTLNMNNVVPCVNETEETCLKILDSDDHSCKKSYGGVGDVSWSNLCIDLKDIKNPKNLNKVRDNMTDKHFTNYIPGQWDSSKPYGLRNGSEKIPEDNFLDKNIERHKERTNKMNITGNIKLPEINNWLFDFYNNKDNKCNIISNDKFKNSKISSCSTYKECEKDYILELNVQAKELVSSKRKIKYKDKWLMKNKFELSPIGPDPSYICMFKYPSDVFDPSNIFDWGNGEYTKLSSLFFNYLSSQWSFRDELFTENKRIIIDRRSKKSEEFKKLYDDKIDLILSDNTSESVKSAKFDSLRDECIKFIENKNNNYFTEFTKNYFGEDIKNKVNIILENITKLDGYIFYNKRYILVKDGINSSKILVPDTESEYPTKKIYQPNQEKDGKNYLIQYHKLVYRKVLYEKLIFPMLKGYEGIYFDIRYPNEKFDVTDNINSKLEEVKLEILTRIVVEKENLFKPGDCVYTLVECNESCKRGTGDGIIIDKYSKNNGKKCPTKVPLCYEGENKCPYKPVDCSEVYSKCKIINGECKKERIIYQEPRHNGKQCVLPEYEKCQDGEGLCPVNCIGKFSKCSSNCTKQFKITREAKNSGSIDCNFGDGEIVSCTGDDCIVSVDCDGNWSDCFIDEDTGICKKKWNTTTEKKGNGTSCRFANGQKINCESSLCNLNNNVNNVNSIDKECTGNFTKCNSNCEKRWILEEVEKGTGSCNFNENNVYKCEEGNGECLISKDCVGRWSTCNKDCKSKWELLEKEQGKNGRCDFINGQEKSCAYGDGLCIKSEEKSDEKSEDSNSNTLIIIIGFLIIIGLLSFNR